MVTGRLQAICDESRILLIEDCAQAHGAEYSHRGVGGFGLAGCFSFYATKNLTTGEGGMITTDDRNLALNLRMLCNQGELSKYNHVMLGYNFRMTEMQAAMGCEQLARLEYMNSRRRANAEYYNQNLSWDYFRPPWEAAGAVHVYHQYVLQLKGELSNQRGDFIKHLNQNGVGSAVHYPRPVHQQPVYQDLGYSDSMAACPVSSDLATRVVSIPVHPSLTEEERERVVDVVNAWEPR